MWNKLLNNLIILFVVLAFQGTAMAQSFAYGTVYSSDKNTIIGANVNAYSDITHMNLIGTGQSGQDGKYSINLGAYSETKVYLVATSDNMQGEAVGSVNKWSTLYLYPVDIYIPEFPIIALPVAGVIGLVFFFQQRKGNK